MRKCSINAWHREGSENGARPLCFLHTPSVNTRFTGRTTKVPGSQVSPAGHKANEPQSFSVGPLARGSYLPSWVQAVSLDPVFLASYLGGRGVDLTVSNVKSFQSLALHVRVFSGYSNPFRVPARVERRVGPLRPLLATTGGRPVCTLGQGWNAVFWRPAIGVPTAGGLCSAPGGSSPKGLCLKKS